ncbi:hypothetical protein LQV05_006494 [Cryptococcus neoformans]|nr:hypothetical protein LQV05_006494 [Cryptococcus neoformans]
MGALLWLAGSTRPDIAFTVSFLSRAISSPTEYHWQLSLRVVAYLSHTRTLGLTLGGGKERGLHVYSDADWAGCSDTRRSMTGYIAYFHGSPVSWCSRRQRTVAHSTMEAEYIAAAQATREIIWLRGLLKEIGLSQVDATTLHIDNQSTICLSHNPLSHEKSKHIDIRYHIIRERVENSEIKLAYIPTEKQRADVFTKALDGVKHGKAVKALRLTREGTGKEDYE